MKPLPISTTACGPLGAFANVCNSLCAKVCAQARLRAGQRRGSDATPRCAGSAAVLAPGSRRITPSARCARCGRTDAASQFTKRASTRADPRAALLAVAYSPRHWPAHSLAGEWVSSRCTPIPTAGWPEGGVALGRLCAAEERRARGRVRTRTLRDLTRCVCSTTASAASGGSYATGPRDRVPQGTRSEAKGKHSEPRRRTALGPALTHRLRTVKFRNGPNGDSQIDAIERLCG
jgi:hypothetical protein